MDLVSYLRLPEEIQFEYLSENGVMIDSCGNIDHKFVLYSVSSFYVEVEIAPTCDNPLGMNAFGYGKELEKYLINLGSLRE
ncbi:MAG: hypothetical protein AAF717_22805 [Bacteroidota bacterium]